MITDMLVETWPIDKPIEYVRNARKITQAAVDKVAASIHEFGFRQPIVVDKDGVIIVGHVRLRAAKKLGLVHVPVHVASNLTPAQVRAYRLMDNRSHEEVEWDIELLGAEHELNEKAQKRAEARTKKREELAKQMEERGEGEAGEPNAEA